MTWDDEAIRLLRELWAAGHSTNEIGRRMGISKNAIVGKAHRLDLDGRVSPIRRNGAPKAISSAPRAIGPTLPMLASETPAAGTVGMAESSGCRSTSQVVIARPLQPAAQKPLPVSLVPLPAPVTLRRGGCQFPLWKGRPEFRPDGSPLMCDAPALGSWCPTHRAICFARRQSEIAA